jgi:hypothetical protein
VSTILGWLLLAGIVAAIWFGRKRGKARFAAAIAAAISQGRADAAAEARSAAVASGGSVALHVGVGERAARLERPGVDFDHLDELAGYDAAGEYHHGQLGAGDDVDHRASGHYLDHPALNGGGVRAALDHASRAYDGADLDHLASLIAARIGDGPVRRASGRDELGELSDGSRRRAAAGGADDGGVGADRAGHGGTGAAGDVGHGVS